jgi:NTP pyrophosphatase (non-canonical NTP hydrolase)
MSTYTAPKTLAELQAEVVAYNHAMGWRENDVTFDEAMALLHTEVAEASDAWRRWGLADATPLRDTGGTRRYGAIKPEGVGSEFADVFIRLLDDCDLYGVDLEAETAQHHGRYGLNESFLTNMNTLHTMIARASMAHESDDWAEEEGNRGGWTWRRQFAAVLVFLRQLSERYGIDLDAEYRRKMAFNRTRPYKHGGKRQ